MIKRKTLLVIVMIISLFQGNMAMANITPSIVVEGNRVAFDSPPYIDGGTTMVPMRVIFEALGSKMVWDEETKTVMGMKGSKAIALTINRSTANVNGKNYGLLKPATVKKGRTVVPLRFVSEALGCEVTWDSKTKKVTINSIPESLSSEPKKSPYADGNLKLKDLDKVFN